MVEPGGLELIVALIAAFSSVIVSVLSIIMTKRSEQSLEEFKAELERRRAEQDARRDYEYEARKRLYLECEPILFQLVELSESALWRIYRLGMTAKQGNLETDRGWLSSTGYFMTSTIYRLLTPLVAFKLLQRKLTLVDLALVPSIKTQYALAKNLFSTFSNDSDLANSDPKLEYYPRAPAPQEIQRNPAKYRKQGVYLGLLDNIVEACIAHEPNGSMRVMSFGEFESTFFNAREVKDTLAVAVDLFLNFHPKTRPVLWRILIAQAYIYRAIKLVQTVKHSDSNATFRVIKSIGQDDLKYFDWRRKREALHDEVFDHPFRAVENYLKDRLSEFWVQSQ